jgi:hypothetical protein
MKLLVGRLSGNSMKANTFRQEQLTFCCRHGGKPLVDNITYACLNGIPIAGKETLTYLIVKSFKDKLLIGHSCSK